MQNVSTDYAWMKWLYSHIGEIEKSGDTPTDFDRRIFDHTDLKLDDKMLAGCAATACCALEESGYKSPHDPMAISFQHYGTPCDLQVGCIVVFEWDSGNHHVTFCNAIVNEEIVSCIGGNQQSKLQIVNYKRKYIIATRWPLKA